jgi:hypothetical protein
MSDYLRQPAVADVRRMLRRGATIREMAKARNCEEHTIRSIMSRMRTVAGLDIYAKKTKGLRGRVYRIGRRAA